MAFTHLHVHTEFSLLDGSNKIKEYVKRVKELGMTSAAITDHGVMYGCIDFYKEAKAQGIKPIMGCEVYVAPNSRFDKELTGGEDRYYHLVLLAENDLGYQNLMKIVSKGFTEGYYYKPRVDMEVLREYHEGIIALSACLAGAVCGDHCSPISDTTIMASAGAQCDHINHVSTQMQYAMPVAVVCVIGYLIAGVVQNWVISLGSSLVILIVVLEVIRKKSMNR